MKNHMINKLVLVENILGVYRNYTVIGTLGKFLAIVRITFEIGITVLLFFMNCNMVFSPPFNNQGGKSWLIIIYHFQNLLSTTVIIICGIYSSGYYKLFLEDFLVIYNCLHKNSTLTKRLKRLKIFFVVSTISFSISSLTFTTYRELSKKLYSSDVTTWLMTMSEVTIEVRFIMEHIVFGTFVYMVHSFLLCLNNEISAIQTKYNIREKMLYSDRRQDDIILTVEQVEKFTVFYQRITTCCKNLSATFHKQMMFALCLTSIQNVISCCGMFTILITHKELKELLNGFYLLNYSIFCLYFVVKSGQQLFNEYSKLKEGLSKLGSSLSIDPDTNITKSIKYFHLLVKLNPIQIEFTKITLGMYLIPIILSLTTNYIVVILQFVHVI